ncbi:hypothetical protein DMX11_11295 [Pseudomonas sp. LB-090624]|nr:hypothetical protein DMX11_11295 [Pseudomonas sp. LB-090624]
MLKAAPEEKRSAFYGVMRDWGREKHDGGMIGEHLPDYLTFWSINTVGRVVGARVSALRDREGQKSSAARAAHRELRSLRLFRANFAYGIFARTPLGMAHYRVGRARRSRALAQTILARNKRRSERSSRCAARAALDLSGAEPLPTYTRTPIPFRTSTKKPAEAGFLTQQSISHHDP